MTTNFKTTTIQSITSNSSAELEIEAGGTVAHDEARHIGFEAKPKSRQNGLRATIQGPSLRIEGDYDGVVELCDLGGRVRGRIVVRKGAGLVPPIVEGLYLVYPVSKPSEAVMVRKFR